MNRGTVHARLKLRLTDAAETRIRAGHPWVYADSVREQNRDGRAGELAVIYDRKDTFLAIGLWDPDSPIRVRILHTGKPQTLDPAWWSALLEQALERRRGRFDPSTNGYRWINGESDGWPGLVLDRYDRTLVLKIYTAAWLPRLEDITGLIQARLQPERINLRLSRNLQEKSAAGETGDPAPPDEPAADIDSSPANRRWFDGQILRGPPLDSPVRFLENGLRFEAEVLRGQKTGFFLDQRENRMRVESLARGRRVLNAFSFSGGFSLYAARGAARSTTDLDISAHALERARQNFDRNGSNETIRRCRHETVQADAFDWLEGHARDPFDLVVLDPPSLAKREVERARAIRAYGRLAESGIQNLAPGGILLACSCSAHVTAGEFYDAVRRAAGRSGRRFNELQTTGPAFDHPATYAEAQYLKGIYLNFG